MMCPFLRILFVWLSLLALTSNQSLSVASTPPIPEEADGPLLVWKEKAKFYLIIAVDDTGVKDTGLPFTITDSQKVVDTFNDLGYQPLIATHPFFQNPTRDDIITALRGIRDFPEHASIVVYYSGHGVAEPKNQDVWLQLGGQKQIGDHFGISVTELIGIPRGATYLGELYVIVDACFSGLGGLSDKLTLRDLGTKTAVLTSNQLKESQSQQSPGQQFSYPITLDGGTQMSAFTHTLLQGLGPNWHIADDNGDGILHISELKGYSEFQLGQIFSQDLNKIMIPQLIATDDKERFLAYRRDGVTRWNSLPRRALRKLALSRKLAPSEILIQEGLKKSPVIREAAKELAKQIPEDTDDLLELSLKAQAEGRLKEANVLLTKAQTQKEHQLENTHALVADVKQQAEKQTEELGRIYLARGRNETYAGNYKDALPWYQKRVALKPTKDPALLNEFGQVWERAGKYETASIYYREALTISKIAQNIGNSSLAISLNNLAELYRKRGKYLEAESLFQRSLAINENVLGPEHPYMATNLNNLGTLYDTQGMYDEAEPLYLRALQISEKFLGDKHPTIAIRLSNLGGLYWKQGEYDKAEDFFERAIKIDEEALGPNHPDLATDLNNMAIVYETQGKYVESENLFRRAIHIDEIALGSNHPRLATNLNNLAELYRKQQKYNEAIPLYQRALRINENALGSNHTEVAMNLNNLAELYRAQGEYSKARTFFQRSLRISKTALGPGHPQVAQILNNLAILYVTQDEEHAEAEALLKRAYEIFKTRLGIQHSNTKKALLNYTIFLMRNEMKEKALLLSHDLKQSGLKRYFPTIFAQGPGISRN